MATGKKFDAVVIGGGFYGCILALHFKRIFKSVVLLEKEPDLLLKASYNNQARIHNGYHYPRSFITALRSHINYARFISDFKDSVVDNSTMIYAIASSSKVTSYQFVKFCKQIGSPITQASTRLRNLFNSQLIEDVFLVEEAVFNAGKLREILKERLFAAKVKVILKKEVVKVSSDGQTIFTHLSNGEKIKSNQVLNCAYANINAILQNSNLPTLPLKHELTEMPLLKMPKEFRKIGITIMDGPFFSIMPFPDKKLHTLHHVRYTPRTSFFNEQQAKLPTSSNSLYMIKDAKRYLPKLENAKYRGSLYEIKTILIQNEISDARPILLKKNYEMKNFHIIMGGKIDNIYDVVSEMGL